MEEKKKKKKQIQKKNTEVDMRSSDATHMQQVYTMKAAQAKNDTEKQSFQQKAQKMQVRSELLQSRSAQKTRVLQEKISELDKKCSELGLNGYHRYAEDFDW